jgi:hypothetical protein
MNEKTDPPRFSPCVLEGGVAGMMSNPKGSYVLWEDAGRAPSSSHPAEGERQSIDTPEFQMLFGALATASINAMTSGNDPDLKRHHEVAWDALIAYIDTWAGRQREQGYADQLPRIRHLEHERDLVLRAAGCAGDAVELLREVDAALTAAWAARELPASVISGDLVRRYRRVLAATPANTAPAEQLDAPLYSTRQDAERFRKAIAAEDAAESLYAAVLNNAPDAAAIRREFDASPPSHLVEQVGEQKELYTCIGKGGEYELIGYSNGAGSKRGESIAVYRRVGDEDFFYHRSADDFDARMQKVEQGHDSANKGAKGDQL